MPEWLMRLIACDPDPAGSGGSGGGGAGNGDALPGAGGEIRLAKREPSKPPAAGAGVPEWTIDAHISEDGKLFGGRFDDPEHALSADLVRENPAIARALKSWHDGQSEITRLRQGKIPLAEPLDDAAINGLNFALDDEGKLPADTAKALQGRPITEREIGMITDLLTRATEHDRQAAAQWREGWNERTGGQLDAILAHAEETLSAEELDDINVGLQRPGLRDAAMQRLADLYAQHTGAAAAPGGAALRQPTPTPTNPLKTGSTNGRPAGMSTGAGLYSKADYQTEYNRDLIAAGRDRQKVLAADAKLKRSLQYHGIA